MEIKIADMKHADIENADMENIDMENTDTLTCGSTYMLLVSFGCFLACTNLWRLKTFFRAEDS